MDGAKIRSLIIYSINYSWTAIIITSQRRQAKAQHLITPTCETGSETGPLVCINQCQAFEAAISFQATFVVSGGINRATRDWKIKSCGNTD